MYNKRTWLNSSKSDSTGSVVCFDGEVTDLDTNKKYPQSFIEISDCSKKVRLHLTSDDSSLDFMKKIHTLKSNVDEFLYYLIEKNADSGDITTIQQGNNSTTNISCSSCGAYLREDIKHLKHENIEWCVCEKCGNMFNYIVKE